MGNTAGSPRVSPRLRKVARSSEIDTEDCELQPERVKEGSPATETRAKPGNTGKCPPTAGGERQGDSGNKTQQRVSEQRLMGQTWSYGV